LLVRLGPTSLKHLVKWYTWRKYIPVQILSLSLAN